MPVPEHVPPPALLFKGPEQMPFLAPRGVWLSGDMLFVSDTGRNRVFIWKNIPETEFAGPFVVLGQESSEQVERNAGKTAGPDTLQYPSGIWSDGKKLIVADAWNHRVLIWHKMPEHSGQAADVVLGQPDFFSNEPNVKGVGAAPNERSLYWPYGVFSDGERLWVADTGNRRVLFFEKIPEQSFSPADGVIGKPDLNTRDYENLDPIWPYSVKIGPNGALAITDTQYYRVLVWENWRQAFQSRADFVIGQPDLDSNGQNQFGLMPQAHTLSWCYDTAFSDQELWVADTGNSRILQFAFPPEHNSPAAKTLLGKPDFFTGSEFADTVFGTENSLYWPFAICIQGKTLAAADTGNHRIAFYHL